MKIIEVELSLMCKRAQSFQYDPSSKRSTILSLGNNTINFETHHQFFLFFSQINVNTILANYNMIQFKIKNW